MSDAPKWTPGPWQTAKPSKVWQVNAETHDIALIVERRERGSSLYDSAETEANAHLIAAAPELYEALERIVRIRKPCSDPTQTDQDTHIEESCRWCKARAALAKATGKE